MVDVLLEYPTKDWLAKSIPMESVIADLLPIEVVSTDTEASWSSRDVPSWLSIHASWGSESFFDSKDVRQQDSGEEHDDALRTLARRRAIELSQVVAVALETTKDTFADRSTSELKSWSRPWGNWFSRLKMTIEQDEGNEIDEAAVPLETSSLDRAEPAEDILRQYDWTIAGLRKEQRATIEPFAFGRTRSFRLLDVSRIGDEEKDTQGANSDAAARRDDRIRGELLSSVTTESSFRWLLRNALVILVGIAGLLALYPYRGRIERTFQQPVIWLIVLGISFLVVAPPPIAIAVILVAICFAAFPNSPRSSSS
jgi:hypothetical protein